MNRLISFSLAALSALTLGATAAHAQEARPVAHAAVPLGYDRAAPPRFEHVDSYWRMHRRRELQRERARFYARWNGDRRRRAEFERWYADQCARLRAGW
jgi:hypothetical protein